jgi:broad specificity phosphatase PhoE
MTAIFLIRHAQHVLGSEVIVGRTPGVGLSAAGQLEAKRVVEQLGGVDLRAIYSSPRQRAVETAMPLAEHLGLRVLRCDAVDEIDYGEWSGRHLDELRADPRFRRWNEERLTTRVPGGETIQEVQTRVVAHLERCAADHPGAAEAVVSHSDVIKAALAHYRGIPLDRAAALYVAPASVSVLEITT